MLCDFVCHAEAHCALSLSGCSSLFKSAGLLCAPTGPHLLIFQHVFHIKMSWIAGNSKLMQKTAYCYDPSYCPSFFILQCFALGCVGLSRFMAPFPLKPIETHLLFLKSLEKTLCWGIHEYALWNLQDNMQGDCMFLQNTVLHLTLVFICCSLFELRQRFCKLWSDGLQIPSSIKHIYSRE